MSPIEDFFPALVFLGACLISVMLLMLDKPKMTCVPFFALSLFYTVLDGWIEGTKPI